MPRNKNLKASAVYLYPDDKARIEWLASKSKSSISSLLRRLALERVTEYILATGERPPEIGQLDS